MLFAIRKEIDVKEFTTAVKEKVAAEPGSRLAPGDLEWTQDRGGPKEHYCLAHRPSPAIIALTMAEVGGRRVGEAQQIAAAINFFADCLDRGQTDTHGYIVDRLLDSDDDFELPEVMDLIYWMMEEWTGGNFPGPTGSSASQSSSGPSSSSPQASVPANF